MANGFKISLYSLTILTCLLLVTYAVHVFPIPGSDSIVFIPPALLYAKGYGLANPLYYVTKFTDLTHTNRFNYYVPFYSFLLGLLSKVHPGIKTIFFFCSLFSCGGLLLYARAVASQLPAQMSGWLKAAALLSITYTATYLLPTVGRPENFTCLFVFLIYLVYYRRQRLSGAALFVWPALLFTLMLCTQLICFFFCFLFYILYEVINSTNLYKTVLRNALLLAVILGLSALLIELTPNGLAHTIEGIRLHIQFVLTRSDRSIPLFINFWVLAPLNIGFLFVFLVAAACFAHEMRTRYREMDSVQKVLVSLLLLAGLYGLGKFILYASPTVYNATEFILPVCAYILLRISREQGKIVQKASMAIVLATFAAGSLLFLRTLALYIDTSTHGRDYDSAKAAMARLTAGSRHICITTALWSLCDDPDRVSFFDESNFKSGDTVFIQQAYHEFPAVLAGRYTLLYDMSRVPQQVRIGGLKIANRPNDFSFVMCRIK